MFDGVVGDFCRISNIIIDSDPIADPTHGLSDPL